MHAIAAVTCMLLNEDPTAVVFDQGALRLHLVKILEANIVSSFPIVKTRRIAERIRKIKECRVYCSCRLPDNGDKMVACDNCLEWFH